MPDELSAYYADFLDGTYDCVDRIVLNAYFRWGQTPGGFRCWWRKWQGSDDDLDNAHLTGTCGVGRCAPGGAIEPTGARACEGAPDTAPRVRTRGSET